MTGEQRRGMCLANAVAVFALFSSIETVAQLKRYSPCDTTIQGEHYNCCKYAWGKLKALANIDSEGRLDGGWIEYGVGHFPRTNVVGQYCEGKKDGEWVFRRRDGEFLWSRSYVNDHLEGEQWTSRRGFVVLDENGKVVAMGSGCRDCPGF